ncbi:MAG: S49 family peptidase [Alphaproteobacteria bacterium]|nr:S49 family peptidase [Alphaproteobacteria bacterium]
MKFKLPGISFKSRPTVAVLRLSGVIGHSQKFSERLSFHDLAPSIEKAFNIKSLSAVALVINSPGGSPVQSSLIADRIRTLAEEKKIPVVSFVEDIAASGGYWLACAGDDIFVNEASLIGSIGVISAGFGFVGLINKLGIERRVYTAGERKSLLDPFKPENPDDINRLLTIQKDLHETFKNYIRQRRGNRLADQETAIFNGDIWSGHQALQLGLIDGIGNVHNVMQAKFGDKTKFVSIGDKKGGLLRKLIASRNPLNVHSWVETIEDKLYWSQYNL